MLEPVNAILNLVTTPATLTRCVITSVTPLEVDLNGATVPGVKITGVTYSLGPAVALWSPPSAPVILPIEL